MLLRLWRDERVRWGLGLTALSVGVVAFMRLGRHPFLQTTVVPGATPPRPPDPLPAVHTELRWVEIPRDDYVMLRRGVRYRGCVDLPWYAPTGIVRDKLRPGLEAKGFTDIVIVEEKPSSWPSAKCTFFVECTWSKADEMLERPSAVTHAWALQ